jgi:hypothetical protein
VIGLYELLGNPTTYLTEPPGVYQLLAHGRWFSPETPASSTTKTGCHDITEILLKVALNTKNQSISQSFILNKPSLLNTGQPWTSNW